MKQAIFINAYKRPRYCRVALDALARCHSLSAWDIWVDIDGGANSDYSVTQPTLTHYQVLRPANLGARDHPTEILRIALTLGYDRILYCEEDHLLRTDALDYITAHPFPEGILSLGNTYGVPSIAGYAAESSCVLHAPLIERLVTWMDLRLFVGLPNVLVAGATLAADCPNHDLCWYAFCASTPIMTRFADAQYSLNFGYTGVDFSHINLECRAFSGPPSDWLANVLRITAETDAPALMHTPSFRYQ